MNIRIVLAQLNLCVGDIEGNAAKIITATHSAKKQNAHLVVFPELAITGYPPEDLLYRSDLYDRVQKALDAICAEANGIDIVLGYPAMEGKEIYNRAGWIHEGVLVSHYDKQNLPNYSVFDEARYFKSGPPQPCLISIQGIQIGVIVCEDIWYPQPIAQAKAAGAEIIVAMNASPFSSHKAEARQKVLRQRIQETGLPIAYLNCVGGQDELVFDGGSMVLDATGNLVQQAEFFKEVEMMIEVVGEVNGNGKVNVEVNGNGLFSNSCHSREGGNPSLTGCQSKVDSRLRGNDSTFFDSVAIDSVTVDPTTCLAFMLTSEGEKASLSAEENIARIYSALVLGLRDYIEKNGFKTAILGLSGGIDSALTLAIMVDAIGKNRVQAVMMPSRYTSELSLAGAKAQAEKLGVQYHELSIEPVFESFLTTLDPLFAGLPKDITEENLQARCRGTLLMAIANKQNAIVLATGNKSEMAVGYSTLYGDMVGGYCVLKDVYKTMVYKLAAYRNTISENIPENVINRAPSAELAPGQKDEDSLPPYPLLDAILERYIEQDQSLTEIVSAGFEKATVQRVMKMVDKSEYKRRQAAIGTRITERAFGKDRRYPITSGFKPCHWDLY